MATNKVCFHSETSEEPTSEGECVGCIGCPSMGLEENVNVLLLEFFGAGAREAGSNVESRDVAISFAQDVAKKEKIKYFMKCCDDIEKEVAFLGAVNSAMVAVFGRENNTMFNTLHVASVIAELKNKLLNMVEEVYRT